MSSFLPFSICETYYTLSLTEAKDNYVLGKLEKRIRQADLLILDEMSYVSFDRFQSELLFKAVSDHSERGSIHRHDEPSIFTVDGTVREHGHGCGPGGPAHVQVLCP